MPYSSPYGDCPPETRSVHDVFLDQIDHVIRTQGGKKKVFITADEPEDYVTYSQLRNEILAVSQFLHNRGFVRQTACTVMANNHRFFSFALGVSMQGGILSGASALFTDYELEQQIVDCQCTTILTDMKHLDKVQRVCRNNKRIKLIIVVDAKEAALPQGIFSWTEVITAKPDVKRSPVPIKPDDVLLLPYSSGTTGTPKGVMLTHKNFATMVKAGSQARRLNGEKAGERVDFSKEYMLLFLPIYHAYGLGLMCVAIEEASTAVIMSHFEPALFLDSIQRYKITTLGVAPPILVFLTKHALCAKYDLSSLTRIQTGGAPAGKDICDEYMRRYPNVRYIQQGYGMTELTMASHMADVQSRSKFGSVGKLVPGLQCKIIHIESGEELPIGQAGELCVKGPTVMLGYYNKPEATKECLRDGWMHTGDIGYLDKDGDLFIVDRLKELIKVKGLQVAPAELEDILLSHPQVSDAAVIGVPDKASGELPKAYVVRADNELTQEQVCDFISEKVSPYKHLKGGVEFVDTIPKAPSGKILRRELRDRNSRAKL